MLQHTTSYELRATSLWSLLRICAFNFGSRVHRYLFVSMCNVYVQMCSADKAQFSIIISTIRSICSLQIKLANGRCADALWINTNEKYTYTQSHTKRNRIMLGCRLRKAYRKLKYVIHIYPVHSIQSHKSIYLDILCTIVHVQCTYIVLAYTYT